MVSWPYLQRTMPSTFLNNNRFSGKDWAWGTSPKSLQGFWLAWFWADSYSFCEFVSTEAVPCPQDSFHSTLPSSLALLLSLLPLLRCPLSLGRGWRLIKLFHLGLSAHCLLSTLTSYVSLHWLRPAAKRSFFNQSLEQPRSMGITINI